jgi:hypothetical protein
MKACHADGPGEIPVGSKTSVCSRRAKVVGLLLLVALVVASILFVIRQKQAEQRSRVMDGMKQFGLALLEFDQEFGGFPSDDTAEEVKDGTGTGLPLTGEHVLNQLKAFGGKNSLSVIDEIGRPDGDWLFFPESYRGSSPNSPILVSPPIGGDRVVLRIDNSVGRMSEGELENLPEDSYPRIRYPENE